MRLISLTGRKQGQFMLPSNNPAPRSKTRLLIGACATLAGVVWIVMFPKTGNVVRPDFVWSLVVGVGLVGTGGIVLLRQFKSPLAITASLVLLWSLLCNVGLLAANREYARLLTSMVAHSSNAHSPR